MAKPLTLALPPDLSLYGDCTVRVAAINPTTGAIVTGVNIANVALEVRMLSGSVEELSVGAWAYVPGPGA